MNSALINSVYKILSKETYGRGAQIYVSRDNECLIDAALGWSYEPHLLQRTTLNHFYCGSKIIGALAMGILLDRRQIDIAAPIGEQFSSKHKFRIAKFSLRDILNHNAGLINPRAHLLGLFNKDIIENMTYESVLNGYTGKPAYSEYAGWAVLYSYIKDKTGVPTEEFIKEEILKPQGLENDIYPYVSKKWLADNYLNIGAGYFELPALKSPTLFVDERYLCEPGSMGFFELTTTKGMGQLYDNCLKSLNGSKVNGMPSSKILQDLLKNNRGFIYDETIGVEADFAGGFMVRLEHLGFAGLSKKAFGFVGMSGTVLSFADPENNVSGAIHLNGAGRGADDLMHLTKTLSTAMLDDFENLNEIIQINKLEVAGQ